MAENKVNKDTVVATMKTLWAGNVPLVKTFWLFHVLVSFVLGVLAGLLPSVLGTLLSVAGLAWAAFMIKPIWLSADKYEGKPLFALLAKIVAVLIAIGVFSTIFS